ncbi:hypothetical protein AN639_03410 [Candidatus Epulonipiscium fishelsonii]|nr:hypothetical protein AN639_03410 [Epulopiscium sp. SCG-B05WGA-EpuloA1]
MFLITKDFREKVKITSNSMYHSRWFVLSIIAYGVAVRVVSYLYNRSLWLDESMISVAMIELDWGDLFGPLNYGESAPIGFLVVSKVLIDIFGSSEYVLRLFPLFSGIASIFVFYKLTTLISSTSVRPIAVALFCTSTGLINYANEVKQYSIDVLMCLVLSTIACLIIKDRGQGENRVVAYGLFLTIALWSSDASIFVASGVGLAMALVFWARRDFTVLRMLAKLSFIGAGNLLAIYLLHFRNILGREFYFDWWSSYFAPIPLWGNYEEIRWYLNTFRNFVELMGIQQITLLGLIGVLFLAGITAMYIRYKLALLLLVIPIALLVLASSLHLYPMGNRLILFLVPYALILLAEGINAFRVRNSRASNIVPIILVILVMSMPIVNSARAVVKPPDVGVREVTTIISEKVNKEDVIYVYYNAKPAFDYYLSDFLEPKGIKTIFGISARNQWKKYEEDLSNLKNFDRVWIFFSAVCCGEEEQFVGYLNSVGNIVYSIVADDVAAYLFSFP